MDEAASAQILNGRFHFKSAQDREAAHYYH